MPPTSCLPPWTPPPGACAFRATLEGIEEADLLVHVADATHPQARAQS
jgi:50S ribosomal subunit-associated GTPase HflX